MHRVSFRFALIIALLCAAKSAIAEREGAHRWQQLAEHADFPESYDYPVHVADDGRFIALHPRGTWASRDGAHWTRTELPFSGMNSAYLNYVQHQGATYALGTLQGNYQAFTITPRIQRTRDYAHWEQLGDAPSLPKVVFAAAASFDGAIWLLGGFDGQRAVNAVWRSTDGLSWTQVTEHAPWSPRASAKAVVFRKRLFVLGGGEIDGPGSNDAWSSADGKTWVRECAEIAEESPVGYTPIVFDDRLWLVGANRSGRFRAEMLVSLDGKTFTAQRAPWTPRGGVAAWTDGQALYLTGGKYSTEVNGETVFAYSNDVWRMQ